MRLLLFVISLASAPPTAAPIEPQWTQHPVQTPRSREGNFFADVMNHCKGAPYAQGDRDTQTHETTHIINSELRITLLKGKTANGFYVGGNRAFLMGEPKMKLADLAPFVPQRLRGDRFGLYLVHQQQALNDSPSYILDEAVAYLNGSRIHVAEAREDEKGKTNAVYSCAEFAVYATAFGMACEKHDPGYWKSNLQVRLFLVWYIREAIGVYRRGMKYPHLRWDEGYYKTLATGKEGRPLREFLRDKLGMNLKELFPEGK